MASPQETILVKDALVFLFAAGIIVPLFKKLHLPLVVGFVIAGLGLGPYGLASFINEAPWLSHITISDPKAAHTFAELGVLFLLFKLGLDFSFEKLWQLRHLVFGAGALQASLSAAFIAFVAYGLGLSPLAATIVGLALALSSTAIVSQILLDQHKLTQPLGRASIAVLLFQDLLLAPILIFIGFAASNDSGNLTNIIIKALVEGSIALLLIYLLGRYCLRPIYQLAVEAGGRELLMALTFFTVIGAAATTANAGLSLGLGAFIAGLLVGETEFKHQIEVDLAPFKGLLLGLFFMTVGMGLNFSVIYNDAFLIISALIGLLLIKALIAFVAIYAMTQNRKTAIEAASLLSPAGEFAFVILTAAVAGGLVAQEHAMPIAAIAGISMLLTPLIAHFGAQAAKRFSPPKDSAYPLSNYSDSEGHVIIAGFGRVGHAVARILETEDANFVALDTNTSLVSNRRKQHAKVYYGDAARSEMLQRAGASGAALFVITVDDKDQASAMVKAFRRLSATTPVFARARDAEHAGELLDAGANFVIPDAVEAGLQLAGRALEQFGLDNESVQNRLTHERDVEYERGTKNEETGTDKKG